MNLFLRKAKPGMVILLFVLIASSCGGGLDLGDFDSEKWKEDLSGCEGERVVQLKELEILKPKLLGLYQKAILKVLGPPEEQELSKRSQVYYSYYIDAGPQCDSHRENARKLEIRFTALGIANEVNIK